MTYKSNNNYVLWSNIRKYMSFIHEVRVNDVIGKILDKVWYGYRLNYKMRVASCMITSCVYGNESAELNGNTISRSFYSSIVYVLHNKYKFISAAEICFDFFFHMFFFCLQKYFICHFFLSRLLWCGAIKCK